MTCPAISCNGFNVSLLQPTQYQLIFDKIDCIPFFCHSVEFPSLSMNFANFATPLHDIHLPGDKLEFSNLTADIVLDKDILTYKSIYDWMRGISVRDGLRTEDTDSCVLIIGESTQIRFNGVFPLNISPFRLQSNATDTDPISFTVSFNVVDFEFI